MAVKNVGSAHTPDPGSKLASSIALGPTGMERRFAQAAASGGEAPAGVGQPDSLLAVHEARAKELAELEVGPVAHEVRNLRACLEAVARRVEVLEHSRPVDRSLVGPAVEKGEGTVLTDRPSPPKPWEAEGLSKATYYRRLRQKKESDHGSSGN
jgi:hypothetical protein